MLDLSGLDHWPEHLASKARALIMAFHDIFSLDPCELGCTSSVEHDIKVTNEVPFKERFRRIPPDMVDEVHEHIRNMQEAGAIRPSNVQPMVQRCGPGVEKGWRIEVMYQFPVPE